MPLLVSLRGRIAVATVVAGAWAAVAPMAAWADEAFAAVAELVRSTDPDLRAVGLERVRDGLRGEAASIRLAETLLPGLEAACQPALLAALADRGDPAALPGVRKLAEAASDPAIRAGALATVAALAGGDDVPLLVGRLGAGGPEADAARRGLLLVDGPGATAALLAAARGAPRDARLALIEILAARRVTAAAPDLAGDASGDDEALRGAALRALGQLGTAAEVPTMVQGMLRSTAGQQRDEAERALVAVCTAGRDRQRAAEAFLGQFAGAAPDARRQLVGVLGRIGGPEARGVVDHLLADPAQRAVGLEALSRWPDATVKDRLLELLAATGDEKERDVLLGTLIRIAPLPNNTLDDKQKLELLRRTMDLCRRDEDRRRVLERANAIRTVDTLRFVVPYLDQPALAESACLSVVELAHHQQLRDGNKEEFTKALDRVIATTNNAEFVERCNRYKEGRTWNRKAPGG